MQAGSVDESKFVPCSGDEITLNEKSDLLKRAHKPSLGEVRRAATTATTSTTSTATTTTSTLSSSSSPSVESVVSLNIRALDGSVCRLRLSLTLTALEAAQQVGSELGVRLAREFGLAFPEKRGWLDVGCSLAQQGVKEDDTLLYKKKFFIADELLSRRDERDIQFLYPQCVESFVSGALRVTHGHAVSMAALQARVYQAEKLDTAPQVDGVAQPKNLLPNVSELAEFLPADFRNGAAVKTVIDKVEAMSLMSAMDAKFQFVHIASSLPGYGITAYVVGDAWSKRLPLGHPIAGAAGQAALVAASAAAASASANTQHHPPPSATLLVPAQPGLASAASAVNVFAPNAPAPSASTLSPSAASLSASTAHASTTSVLDKLPVLLGVSRTGVSRISYKTKELLESYTFDQLQRISFGKQTLVLDFGEHRPGGHWGVSTRSGRVIAQILEGYQTLLREKQNNETTK